MMMRGIIRLRTLLLGSSSSSSSFLHRPHFQIVNNGVGPGACNSYASSHAASLQQDSCTAAALTPRFGCSDGEEEYADLDWDNLGFGITPTDYMYINKCGKDDGDFVKGRVTRYGALELSPCAGVLNYGQGLLEGIKAYRTEEGRLLLFRPDQNALRMKMGADRICMPSPSVDTFVEAVKETTLANKRWVPPAGKGSLYIRPLLMGTGAVLGFAPAPDYTFLVYCSPVGNYFKGDFASLALIIEDELHRATPGGAGGVKCITNYAPVLKGISKAKQRGYSEVLYLDSVHKKYIEEVSCCNIFVLKGNVISTPAASGTILQGITRKSIMEIASDRGYQVEERTIAVEELEDADEVFCTGTAVGVAPVRTVTYQGKRMEFKVGPSTVGQELYGILEGIQTGKVVDDKGWIVEIQ